MRRREFLGLVAGAAALPMVARAQDRARRVGILMNYAESDKEPKSWIAAFRERLRVQASTQITIEERWASADEHRLAAYAAELVAQRPDVLFCFSTPSVAALQRATSSIPIVFVNANDPVGFHFVTSLARPGGNITGFISNEPSMGGKWLDLLKEIAPSVQAVLVPFNPQTHTRQYSKSIQTSANTLAIKVIELPYAGQSDIERGFSENDLSGGGLLVPPDSSNAYHRNLFVSLANMHRLPAVYYHRLFIESGGLASYGADYVDASKKAAEYVARILNGANVSELPVQGPTRFQFGMNLQAAKRIGLQISPLILARADEVIE